MSLPPVRIAHNLKLLGHSDLGGAPNAGEGVFEALGPIPQVPKFPYPRAEFAKTTVDGKTSVELRIEATDPRSFAAKPVEDRILELLLDADPDLRLLKETAEIALSVKLVPKNSLSHFFRIYPGR